MTVFWGISVYFNPAGYRNKSTNYRVFRESSRRQGLSLLLVELVYEGQDAEFDREAADSYVRIHGDSRHLMWQKEALLNIALSYLPPECRYVAWLDADILFDNDNWIDETAALLERNEVVQPYSHFLQLPADADTADPKALTKMLEATSASESFGYGLGKYGPRSRQPFGRTGNAWAARRELLEKHRFYDRMVLGDADSFMAYAFVGCGDFLARNGRDFPEALVDHYRNWAAGVHGDVNGRVGCTPGHILHLWHGETVDRCYNGRRALLRRYAFDPVAHVGRRADGLLEWTAPPQMLRAATAEYFRQRREECAPIRSDPPKKILITGMSGVVGGIVGRAIADRYTLCALSRTPIDGVETVIADIRDVASMTPAFAGIDTVVHFAAYCAGDGIRHIDVNIRGSYNLLEAAAVAGVKRVVYVSSGAVQEAYEREAPYLSMVKSELHDTSDPAPVLTHLDPVRPLRMYGVAKACVEIMGRMYAETGRLSVICLRLGRVRPDDRPHNPREVAVYLSHRDLIQLVEKSIEAPESLRFGIYYGVSDNRMRFRDLGPACDDLGFAPQDGVEPWFDDDVEQNSP